MDELSGGTPTRKEKRMDFRIVLIENEGYATARGDKGVQDILAAKTESGYIKEGTFLDQSKAPENRFFYVLC